MAQVCHHPMNRISRPSNLNARLEIPTVENHRLRIAGDVIAVEDGEPLIERSISGTFVPAAAERG
jgi:hypothetical protein